MSPYKPKNDPKAEVPTIANNDQLKMILKVIGKQEETTDLSFVTSEYALKYIRELQGSIDHTATPQL